MIAMVEKVLLHQRAAAMEFLALGDLVFGPKSGQNVAVQQSGTSFAASALGGLICLILQVLKLCQVGVKLRSSINSACFETFDKQER